MNDCVAEGNSEDRQYCTIGHDSPNTGHMVILCQCKHAHKVHVVTLEKVLHNRVNTFNECMKLSVSGIRIMFYRVWN